MPKPLAYWVSSELVYPYTRVNLQARTIVCVQAVIVVLTLCKMTASQTQIPPPAVQTLTCWRVCSRHWQISRSSISNSSRSRSVADLNSRRLESLILR